MFLFYRLYRFIFLPYIDNQVSLRIKRLLVSYLIKKQYKRSKKNSYKIRTFVSAFNLSGSLTVEAALAVTFFMTVMLSLVSILQMFCTYQTVHRGLLNSGYEAASAGDAVLGSGAIMINMNKYLDSDILEENGIENGVSGISWIGTYADVQNQKIVLNAAYKVKPALLMLPGISVTMRHHLEFNIWSGYHGQQTSSDNMHAEKVYYIAENESVYHTSAQCTHLRLSVKVIDYAAIESYRNSSGQCYSECSKCSGYTDASMVYITEDGTKYHYTMNCSALKRTIYQIQDIGALEVCSRCGEGL